jgi:hypothetical protein
MVSEVLEHGIWNLKTFFLSRTFNFIIFILEKILLNSGQSALASQMEISQMALILVAY